MNKGQTRRTANEHNIVEGEEAEEETEEEEKEEEEEDVCKSSGEQTKLVTIAKQWRWCLSGRHHGSREPSSKLTKG